MTFTTTRTEETFRTTSDLPHPLYPVPTTLYCVLTIGFCCQNLFGWNCRKGIRAVWETRPPITSG